VWVRNALAADGEVIEDGSQAADFSDDVEAAVRRYQARHGLEVDGLVGPLTWFTMYPEFLAATGPLAQYDADGSGRIEPAEVRPMGDSNAICDVPPGEDCPAPGAP
jgi:peptidoglycan hydrolase-like protein with peptidoglycan-binding domain